MMNEQIQSSERFSRRSMLKTVSGGFGYLAFSALAAQAAASKGSSPLAPRAPHFTPRA